MKYRTKLRKNSKTIFVAITVNILMFRIIVLGNGNNVQENILKEHVNKLVHSIIRKDADVIIKMLPDNINIELATDYWKSKKEIVKDFEIKGVTYLYLFDSVGFNNYRKKFYKYNQKFETKLSIRDELVKVSNKNLRIDRLFVVANYPQEKIVNVYLTWDGKKSFKEGGKQYYFRFRFVNSKWFLTSLIIRD